MLIWLLAALLAVSPASAQSARDLLLFGGGANPVVYTDFTQLNNLTLAANPNYAYSTTSLRTVTDATGAITYAPNNLLLNSATLSMQGVSTSAINYLLTFTGTGSVTLSGAATGTLTGTGASNRVYLKVTATAGTLTVTVSGSVTAATLSAVTYETTPRAGDQVVTTSAAYYGPAFDYNPTTLLPQGLRIEGSGTNLNYPSTNLTGIGTGFTSTPNYAMAPDNTTSGQRLVWSGISSSYAIGTAFSYVSGTTYTASAYVKANLSTSSIDVEVGDNSGSGWARYVYNFGTSSGATATGNGGGITYSSVTGGSAPAPNGYTRIWVTATLTGTAAYGMVFGVETHVAGAGDVTAWGYQLEATAVPSSYIPTNTSATSTRAADVFTLVGPAVVASAHGRSITESKSEATGVISRTAYAPGALAIPANSWLRKLAIFPPGVSAAKTATLLNPNGPL